MANLLDQSEVDALQKGVVKGLLTRVGAGLTAGTISRSIESSMEAAQTYDEARAQGMTHEEAKRAANQVFMGNMKLIGVDAIQLAVAFAPTGGAVTGSLVARGLATVGRVGGKLVFTGLTEGGEELYQLMVQRKALGDDVAGFAIGRWF